MWVDGRSLRSHLVRLSMGDKNVGVPQRGLDAVDGATCVCKCVDCDAEVPALGAQAREGGFEQEKKDG
jgi:hypothetical protein